MGDYSQLVVATLFAQTTVALTAGLLLLAFPRTDEHAHVRPWMWSWFALAVYFAGTAGGGFLLPGLPMLHPARLSITTLSQIAAVLHVFWLVRGTLLRVRPAARLATLQGHWVTVGAIVVGVALALAFTWDPELGRVRFGTRLAGRALLALAGFGTVAVLLWGRRATTGRRTFAAGAIIGALSQGAYAWLALRMLSGAGLPDAVTWLGALDLGAQVAIAIGMVLWLLEDERAARVRATATLAASEARHRRIVEGSGAALWEEDLSGLVAHLRTIPAASAEDVRAWLRQHPAFVQACVHRIRVLGVNDATLRLYEAESKEELLANLPRLFLPESYDVFLEELVAFWEGRTDFDAEVATQTLRGERRVLFYSIRAPFPEEGFSYVLLSVVDVTPLKVAEAALRESEERYRTLFDNAPVGIGVADQQGNLLAVNATMRTLGGYAPGDALPHVAELYDDPAVRDALLAELRQRGVVRQREVRFRRKDGTPFDTTLSLATVTIDGAPSVLAIVEDSSERRRLEDALRQAQKMEAVGQLTGGIAHDFNNFLTAIQVNAELAAELVTTDPAEAREALGAVRRTSERSAALVRSLLAFSRREGLRLTPIALGAVLEETTRMLRRLLPESIVIRCTVPEALREATVAGDRSAIEQMLVNLATNARDAMPGGGTFALTLRRATLDTPVPVAGGEIPAGAWLCIAATDSGSGVPDEHVERVFEPFFTTKPQGAGSGLGLAMVFGLIRQHGGGIRLERSPEGGASFELYFAPTDGRTAEPEAGTGEAPRGLGETVLVVEDEKAIREATRRLLERSGYRVLTAADGADGLATLVDQADAIALVVADVVMPALSGPDLLAAARERGLTTPFLFMSGYADREARRHALDPSVPLLAKPWRAGDLLDLIRTRIGRA